MSTAEGKELVVSRGNDLAEDFSAEYYAAYIRKDGEKFRKVIEDIGFPKQ
jgi:hypothetical protein